MPDGGIRWSTKTNREPYQSQRVMSAIINTLRAAEGGWVSVQEMVDHVYQGDPPDWPESCIGQTVTRLILMGYPIQRPTNGGASRGYRFWQKSPNENRVYDLAPNPPQPKPSRSRKLALVPGKLREGA